MTPVRKGIVFFGIGTLFMLAFAIDGFVNGSLGQGVFGLIGAGPAAWLVARAVRLDRAGVYVDYRRPKWERNED